MLGEHHTMIGMVRGIKAVDHHPVTIRIEIKTHRSDCPVLSGHLAHQAAAEAQTTGVEATQPDQVHHLVGWSKLKLRLRI